MGGVPEVEYVSGQRRDTVRLREDEPDGQEGIVPLTDVMEYYDAEMTRDEYVRANYVGEGRDSVAQRHEIIDKPPYGFCGRSRTYHSDSL